MAGASGGVGRAKGERLDEEVGVGTYKRANMDKRHSHIGAGTYKRANMDTCHSHNRHTTEQASL